MCLEPNLLSSENSCWWKMLSHVSLLSQCQPTQKKCPNDWLENNQLAPVNYFTRVLWGSLMSNCTKTYSTPSTSSFHQEMSEKCTYCNHQGRGETQFLKGWVGCRKEPSTPAENMPFYRLCLDVKIKMFMSACRLINHDGILHLHRSSFQMHQTPNRRGHRGTRAPVLRIFGMHSSKTISACPGFFLSWRVCSLKNNAEKACCKKSFQWFLISLLTNSE